jgi:hypothetical protein
MADINKMNMDACRKYQAHYDEHLSRHVGFQTPQPSVGEHVNHYRARCMNAFARAFLPPIHDLYKIGYHKLMRDAVRDDNMVAFNNFEKMNIEACKVEAFNPNYVAPGEFRMISKRNQFGHETERVFIGPEHFVKQMGRPGRRVVTFNTPQGPMTPGGQYIRR